MNFKPQTSNSRFQTSKFGFQISESGSEKPGAGDPKSVGLGRYYSVSAGKRGFTLIELLVVIAIMAILAGLLFPAVGAVSKQKKRTKAKGELQKVASEIENYKTKKNFYPPSPTNEHWKNPLYYELAGTTLKQGVFTTLDGSSSILAADVPGFYAGVGGFVNVTHDGAGDEGQGAQVFMQGGMASGQSREVIVGGKTNIVLGTTQEGPVDGMLPAANGTQFNPFRYNSVSPTNNPKSFDLWVDILVGGKTNRICNWSDKYIVL